MVEIFSYYLENLVNHAVCLGQKRVKILLKVINVNRELNLGTVALSQNSIDVASWLLLSTFLINRFVRNRC